MDEARAIKRAATEFLRDRMPPKSSQVEFDALVARTKELLGRFDAEQQTLEKRFARLAAEVHAGSREKLEALPGRIYNERATKLLQTFLRGAATEIVTGKSVLRVPAIESLVYQKFGDTWSVNGKDPRVIIAEGFNMISAKLDGLDGGDPKYFEKLSGVLVDL